MGYFDRKTENKNKAIQHTFLMNNLYPRNIEYSILNTQIFNDKDVSVGKNPDEKESDIIVDAIDSVTAIFKYKHLRTAVLNFASYKSPGGLFLEGSSAQEESLCHESTLYNVISSDAFKDYYEHNNQHKNRALYLNRALYSPDIVFESYKCDGTTSALCDVITCAAPNYTAAKKYNTVDLTENNAILKNRIDFVLSIAVSNYVNTLILGAYGCGVFGQNPTTVASIFKDLLNTKYKGYFDTVVFAIPDSSSYNYTEFRDAFAS